MLRRLVSAAIGSRLTIRRRRGVERLEAASRCEGVCRWRIWTARSCRSTDTQRRIWRIGAQWRRVGGLVNQWSCRLVSYSSRTSTRSSTLRCSRLSNCSSSRSSGLLCGLLQASLRTVGALELGREKADVLLRAGQLSVGSQNIGIFNVKLVQRRELPVSGC